MKKIKIRYPICHPEAVLQRRISSLPRIVNGMRFFDSFRSLRMTKYCFNTFMNHAGFTLAELLIVVGIITTLSIAGLMSFNNARERAKISQALSDIQEIRQAVEQYHADVGFYPPNSNAGVDPGLVTAVTSVVCNNNRPTCQSTWPTCCPHGYDTSLITSKWYGPYLSGKWAGNPTTNWGVKSPWGNDYDYDYHERNMTQSGCTYGPGVYIAINGDIPRVASDYFIQKGLDSCNDPNNTIVRVLIKSL